MKTIFDYYSSCKETVNALQNVNRKATASTFISNLFGPAKLALRSLAGAVLT